MIEKKYKISWNDIDILYQELNNQRNRFGMTQVVYNKNDNNKITTNHVKELNDEVEAMAINGYIGDKAYTNIIIPNKKTKITTLEFKTIGNKIDYIGTICPDCGCDGYCPDCGCDGYCPDCGCDDHTSCGDCDCDDYCSWEGCTCDTKCYSDCGCDGYCYQCSCDGHCNEDDTCAGECTWDCTCDGHCNESEA